MAIPVDFRRIFHDRDTGRGPAMTRRNSPASVGKEAHGAFEIVAGERYDAPFTVPAAADAVIEDDALRLGMRIETRDRTACVIVNVNWEPGGLPKHEWFIADLTNGRISV